jgi:hypothetical protein
VAAGVVDSAARALEDLERLPELAAAVRLLNRH